MRSSEKTIRRGLEGETHHDARGDVMLGRMQEKQRDKRIERKTIEEGEKRSRERHTNQQEERRCVEEDAGERSDCPAQARRSKNKEDE